MNDKKNINRTLIFICFIMLTLCFIYHAQFVLVDGDSMNPTFHNGQFLMMQRQNYEKESLHRYDVIVFDINNQLLIKRVIALPGESIYIDEKGQIYINDEKLDEPITFDTIQTAGIANKKIVLSDNECFVLGDNRNNSMDSREQSIGPVKISQIKGKISNAK